ncbi:MAG: NAD-dependent epimerase/dehydratase family protein [Rhodospirillales bacterium]|jgi:nucleoside-diphosphate-sugar epimerase|nr:NAD-dependent epimerase/dehydratase family protein [Rhodospirillales bacterium]
MRKILVTGALGRVGSELVPALRERHGTDRVVASDNRAMPTDAPTEGPFEKLDCTRVEHVEEVVRRHDVGTIYHFAALLSAAAEARPDVAWKVNVGGLQAVLEVARRTRSAVFLPSSIGAFGPTTPGVGTPQDTTQRPTTLYGITKVTAELLCDYHFRRFGLDTRGLRLPCLVSLALPEGGGTTDYAVEIFHQALRQRRYTCRLAPDTRLDMMYMPDAVAAIIGLMEAEEARLIHRNAFNVTAMNFTPARLAEEITKHIPDFTIDYDVDPVRQAVADSWPRSVDDSAARAEWDWAPAYNLQSMTRDMIDKLKVRAAP